MEDESFEEDEATPFWKSPLRWALAIFLLLIIILWAVPYYAVRLDPEPRGIPSLSKIQQDYIMSADIGNMTGISSINAAIAVGYYKIPAIKQASTAIVAESCRSSRVCQAKALYYFVRDNIEYVPDPYENEYIASPIETLKTGGGDCDDGAVLLAEMMKSIGIDAEIVVVPGHALIKARVDEAPEKYKSNDWIYLDWTCGRCVFGEIDYNSILQLEIES